MDPQHLNTPRVWQAAQHDSADLPAGTYALQADGEEIIYFLADAEPPAPPDHTSVSFMKLPVGEVRNVTISGSNKLWLLTLGSGAVVRVAS